RVIRRQRRGAADERLEALAAVFERFAFNSKLGPERALALRQRRRGGQHARDDDDDDAHPSASLAGVAPALLYRVLLRLYRGLLRRFTAGRRGASGDGDGFFSVTDNSWGRELYMRDLWMQRPGQ